MADSPDKIPDSFEASIATEADAEQVRMLIHDNWIETMGAALEVSPERLEPYLASMMTEEGLEGWRQTLANPPEGRATFVARRGSEIIGVCAAQRDATDKGENRITAFHVKAGRRGIGIGKALWQAAEKFLDPRKDTIVWPTVGTEAVEVYKRLGFTETGITEKEVLEGTEPELSRLRVKMVKKAVQDKRE